MTRHWTLQQVDPRLERQVEHCLDVRDVPIPEDVRVRAEGGVVEVYGWIDSERAKDLLLRCCRHVPGVVRLVDGISVGGDHKSQWGAAR